MKGDPRLVDIFEKVGMLLIVWNNVSFDNLSFFLITVTPNNSTYLQDDDIPASAIKKLYPCHPLMLSVILMPINLFTPYL